jgi:hypothetical protein
MNIETEHKYLQMIYEKNEKIKQLEKETYTVKMYYYLVPILVSIVTTLITINYI